MNISKIHKGSGDGPHQMTNRIIYLIVVVVVAVFGLAACDRTNWEPSLFRTISKSDASIITDAKQRVIINRKRYGQPDKQDSLTNRVVCAEPSPDVAQAFSEAIKIAANLSKPVTGANPERDVQNTSASFAHSLAASIAQLGERLAVIQLFRDRMYRICEAYANGAIDEVAYTLILSRNDKTMTTLLTTEMVAGAYGRPLSNLSSAAGTSGANLKKRVDLQKQIVELTANLAQTAKSEDNQVGRAINAQETAEKLAAAHTELLALDFAAARTSALSGDINTASQSIQNRPLATIPAGVSSQIVAIHRNYIDDPGIEPLIDACLVSLSTIKLNDQQAKFLAKADTRRAEAAAAIEIINLDTNTIDVLREYRESGVDEMTKSEINLAIKFNVDANDDKIITDEEITTRIQSSETSRSKAEDKLREANIAIKQTLFAAKNPFAAFCLTNVFGDPGSSGYVNTMINARRELRELDQTTDNEIRLKQLEICKMLIDELKQLPEAQQKESRNVALAMCEKLII